MFETNFTEDFGVVGGLGNEKKSRNFRTNCTDERE